MARAKQKEKYKTRPDGRKYTLVNTGRYTEDGKPERIPVYGRTDAEVDQKKAEIKFMASKGLISGMDNVPMAMYAERWVNLYKGQKRRNTFRMYNSVVRSHIIPYFGDTPLRKISSDMCQDLINQNMDKPGACEYIGLVLKQIQKRALIDGIIVRPFFVDISMPKRKKSTRRPLTAEERDAVSAADLQPMDRCYVDIIYSCGLRREEAMALQKDCIDREKREIIVRQVWTDPTKKDPMIEHTAKTDNSIRRVPIPISFYQGIVDYADTVEDFLFTNKAGAIMNENEYMTMWRRVQKAISKELGEKTILTAHYFRHNYCSVMAYHVSEIKMIELMGHADSTMIKEVYRHVLEEQEQTVAKLDQYMTY